MNVLRCLSPTTRKCDTVILESLPNLRKWKQISGEFSGSNLLVFLSLSGVIIVALLLVCDLRFIVEVSLGFKWVIAGFGNVILHLFVNQGLLLPFEAFEL
ncbi:hypothetical protein CEXT_168511 [Caerostris extrusa]|uniref:Uncharacterized protein n=1 Tax=Caerostris extrusa TaxID=172846 RepID=A0AAV4MVT4_CAEEX|nr:hypothetical protein CEXT_168511 [Caerostris extrusa]